MRAHQLHQPGTAEVHLGPRGAMLLATALCLMLTGVFTGLYVVCAWGVLMVAFVSISYARTVTEMSGEPGAGIYIHLGTPVLPERILRAGTRIRFGVRIENRSKRAWVVRALRLVHSKHLEEIVDSEVPDDGVARTVEREISIGVLTVGPHTVFGVQVCAEDQSGLCGWSLYVPQRWAARALPRDGRFTRSRLHPRSPIYAAHTLPPIGAALAGTSLDLKELRERVAGDSFRHIAWKASARHGKLMVREYETDVGMSVYLVLDAGPSMRVGYPGMTPLDEGIDMAYGLAEDLGRRRSRVGVVLADLGLLAFEKASPSLGGRVAGSLMGAYGVVDASRTEAFDREILEQVAEYAWSQYGRWFYAGHFPEVGVPEELRPGTRGVLDELSLHAWVQDRLNLSEYSPGERLASTDQMHHLRAFCAMEGLDLQYRTLTRSDQKEADLCEALQKVSQCPGGPHGIVLFTDLDGIPHDGALYQEIRRLRRQRYDITVLHPTEGSGTGIPVEWEDLLEDSNKPSFRSVYETLLRLYTLERIHDYREWQVAMAVVGVPVLGLRFQRRDPR